MQTIPCCFIIYDSNDLHIFQFYAKILCHIYIHSIYSLSKYGIIMLTVETFQRVNI